MALKQCMQDELLALGLIVPGLVLSRDIAFLVLAGDEVKDEDFFFFGLPLCLASGGAVP